MKTLTQLTQTFMPYAKIVGAGAVFLSTMAFAQPLNMSAYAGRANTTEIGSCSFSPSMYKGGNLSLNSNMSGTYNVMISTTSGQQFSGTQDGVSVNTTVSGRLSAAVSNGEETNRCLLSVDGSRYLGTVSVTSN